jgi:transposase
MGWNRAGTSRDDRRALIPAVTRSLVPALPSIIVEPLWVQVAALLPAHQVHHPLGCHRPRIPDCVVFDKLIQVLVFGRGNRRIADAAARQLPCAAPGMSGSAPGYASGSTWRCWSPMTGCSA